MSGCYATSVAGPRWRGGRGLGRGGRPIGGAGGATSSGAARGEGGSESEREKTLAAAGQSVASRTTCITHEIGSSRFTIQISDRVSSAEC